MVRWFCAHSYSGSSTKSSRIRWEMGVRQDKDEWSPESISSDMMEAVNALVVLPARKRVEGVTGVEGNVAFP